MRRRGPGRDQLPPAARCPVHPRVRSAGAGRTAVRAAPPDGVQLLRQADPPGRWPGREFRPAPPWLRPAREGRHLDRAARHLRRVPGPLRRDLRRRVVREREPRITPAQPGFNEWNSLPPLSGRRFHSLVLVWGELAEFY